MNSSLTVVSWEKQHTSLLKNNAHEHVCFKTN